MSDRDILMAESGALAGLIAGMFLSWAIATTLNHQRDFWQDAYCAAEDRPPAFCKLERRNDE